MCHGINGSTYVEKQIAEGVAMRFCSQIYFASGFGDAQQRDIEKRKGQYFFEESVTEELFEKEKKFI